MPTLVDQLNAARTLEELDDLALAKIGYWSREERATYERRAKQLKAWDDDAAFDAGLAWGGQA